MPIPMSSVQIADDLAARIRSGEYPPGERLPSYAELAELYDVSVSTVQQVLVRLKERGLVVGLQGRGTYVSDPPAG